MALCFLFMVRDILCKLHFVYKKNTTLYYVNNIYFTLCTVPWRVWLYGFYNLLLFLIYIFDIYKKSYPKPYPSGYGVYYVNCILCIKKTHNHITYIICIAFYAPYHKWYGFMIFVCNCYITIKSDYIYDINIYYKSLFCKATILSCNFGWVENKFIKYLPEIILRLLFVSLDTSYCHSYNESFWRAKSIYDLLFRIFADHRSALYSLILLNRLDTIIPKNPNTRSSASVTNGL